MGSLGPGYECGALHFPTPERVTAAAKLVRDGVSVSLSSPVNTVAAVDCPTPADHRMTAIGSAAAPPPIHFIKDYVGVDYHNDGHTHIDALCHVGYEGMLYNGKSVDTVTRTVRASTRSKRCEMGSSGVGCCSTFGATARNAVARARRAGSARISSRPSASRRHRPRRRHPAGAHGARTTLTELGPWKHPWSRSQDMHPNAMRLSPTGRLPCWAQTGTTHGPQHHRGRRLPDPRPRHHSAGHSPPGLPRTRGCPVESRMGGALGVPARRRTLRIAGGTGSPVNPIAVF